MTASGMTATGPLARLWDETWQRLLPLGMRPLPLSPDLASANGPGQRQSLEAATWQVGEDDAPLADCRIVHIQGPTVEIINTMIFPMRPERLPVFAAELLVFGGRPRLTFVDLQVPGLAEPWRAEIATITNELSNRYSVLPREQDVPTWAVTYSGGGHVFTRSDQSGHLPVIIELYHSYLDSWAMVVEQAARENMTGSCPKACRTLQQYKREHVAHSPGTGFLGKVFGQDWTERFLNTFLYR